MRVLLIEDDSATAQSIELMLKSESFNLYTTDLGEVPVAATDTPNLAWPRHPRLQRLHAQVVGSNHAGGQEAAITKSSKLSQRAGA